MAAMKREKQYDMFDVATGTCELDDYLNQRYSENDLQSKFWVEKSDEVDELRPPPPGSESSEPVLIPIQGPRADKARQEPQESPAATRQEAVLPQAGSPSPQAELPSQPPATPSPPAVTEAPAWETRQEEAVSVPSMETFQPSRAPESTPNSEPSSPEGKPPSMEELLAQFHQATRAYQERADREPPTEAAPET